MLKYYWNYISRWLRTLHGFLFANSTTCDQPPSNATSLFSNHSSLSRQASMNHTTRTCAHTHPHIHTPTLDSRVTRNDVKYLLRNEYYMMYHQVIKLLSVHPPPSFAPPHVTKARFLSLCVHSCMCMQLHLFYHTCFLFELVSFFPSFSSARVWSWREHFFPLYVWWCVLLFCSSFSGGGNRLLIAASQLHLYLWARL